MNRQVTVGHMLFTVSVKDGNATWSVRPSEAVENKYNKVLFQPPATVQTLLEELKRIKELESQ